MLWLVLAGMTGLAVLSGLWPLAFRRRGGADAASEVAFYKAQIDEIERDLERGQLPAEEAAGARAEAARRLIAASAAAPVESGVGNAATPRRTGAALILVAVPLVALALYANLGRPDLRDAPLAGRMADANSAEGMEAALARIEAHLTASPDDAKGWAVIAPVYMHLGRFDDAATAFGEILRLEGESADRRAGYGEALVGAAGGVVTADARAAFDKALAEQPGLPAARFYLGLAAEQDGDKSKAIAIYQGLLSETPPDAPWVAALKARLAAVKGESAPSAPAPAASNEAPATTPAASDDAQQATIRGMVERLATRLATSGGGAEEWQRLVRSYTVLHEPDKARDALASARKALAGDAAAGPGLDALARELGIEGESAASASVPSTPSAPAASNEAPATTPAASDDAQQAAIRSMVERLATRLATSGGDANEWGQLIRSYAVLREPDKAKDALASARKALAGDAAAGPGLDALARELGIEGESAASASVPSAPSAPAASNEAPATTPAASDDAQQAAIRSMVERLATRLAQSGGDANEWGQLIRSYAVLREPDKARDALASARKALAGDAAAGPGLDALARELGIEGESAVSASDPSAPSAPAPAASNEAPATTPAASDDAQQTMIRGMVEQLATRLATRGGGAEEWQRLIRSYAVLHETDKAKDALASARKALAGDAAAGPGLDALARELGIGG